MTSASARLERVGSGAAHDGMLPRMARRPAAGPMPSSPATRASERVVARRDDARAPHEVERRGTERARRRPAARRPRPPRAPAAAPAAMSIERAPRGRRLATASTRPSARWQSASASEPSTRTRSTSPGSAAAAGARCSGRVASSATSCSRSSGRERAERHAVDGRAAAAAGDPLLAVAEVVDVAERDVGHRRAVGHRDREGVHRQAALRVEAAVDRVDHDAPAAAAAVAALADLLGDDREALALAREALEHGRARRPRPPGRRRPSVSPPAPRPSSSARCARGTAATAAATPSRIARQISSQRSTVTGRTDRAG